VVVISKEAFIRSLGLRPHHDEGGYYSEQYRSPERLGDGRIAMDTIYYMLTDDSPLGHFHKNRSDIVHFYHSGGPLRYTSIDSRGTVETFVLGPDIDDGQQLQRVVRGGCWKASELLSGSYGLISEAVVPAFSAADRVMATSGMLKELFPQLDARLLRLAWP
jgi:predicted cupin superfamily sugar epimerase